MYIFVGVLKFLHLILHYLFSIWKHSILYSLPILISQKQIVPVQFKYTGFNLLKIFLIFKCAGNDIGPEWSRNKYKKTRESKPKLKRIQPRKHLSNLLVNSYFLVTIINVNSSCSGHPTKEEIEKEFAACPLSLEEMEAVEIQLQASLKTRPR